MVHLQDFKKALGKKADKYTDAELERLNALCERLAGALFDGWTRKLKEQGVIEFKETIRE